MCHFKKKRKKTEICDSTQVPGLNIWFYGVPFSTLGNTGGRVGLGESRRVWSWMCWVASAVGVQVGGPWLAFVAMIRHQRQHNWTRGYCQGWGPGAPHKESGIAPGVEKTGRRGTARAPGRSHINRVDQVLGSRKKTLRSFHYFSK